MFYHCWSSCDLETIALYSPWSTVLFLDSPNQLPIKTNPCWKYHTKMVIEDCNSDTALTFYRVGFSTSTQSQQFRGRTSSDILTSELTSTKQIKLSVSGAPALPQVLVHIGALELWDIDLRVLAIWRRSTWWFDFIGTRRSQNSYLSSANLFKAKLLNTTK